MHRGSRDVVEVLEPGAKEWLAVMLVVMVREILGMLRKGRI